MGAPILCSVPLGFEIQHWLELSRNPYDKIGHFMRVVSEPALLAREVLLRPACQRPQDAGVRDLEASLAFSAFYELIEWGRRCGFGSRRR